MLTILLLKEKDTKMKQKDISEWNKELVNPSMDSITNRYTFLILNKIILKMWMMFIIIIQMNLMI